MGEWKILEPMLHKGRTALIKLNGEIVGLLSEVHPKLLNELKLPSKVAVFELNIEKIAKDINFMKEFKPISPYQEITRDLSFYINKDVLYSNVIDVIKGIKEPDLKDIGLIDVFEPKEDPIKRSMTITIKLQSDTKTLKDEDANKFIDKVIEELEKQLKAVVRKNIT